MRPLLFLKATVKKMIQVPGYYRKDGTYVPPHQKMVHYDPDKEVSHVLEGKGSHSQKKALKQVKGKVKDFDSLPADHKFAIILSHATDIQEKASHAAAISGWKKKALSGKNPTPAQWAAFQKLNPVQRDQMLFLVKEKVGSVDHLDIPESEPEKPAEDGASKKDAEAAAFMEALAKGEGKHYELKAYKKMLVDEKFKSLAPHAQADAVKIMAADMQKAASISAAISVMKKRLLEHKAPTKAQLKAYHSLPDDKKEAYLVWAGEAGVLSDFWSAYKDWKSGNGGVSEKDGKDKVAKPGKPAKKKAGNSDKGKATKPSKPAKKKADSSDKGKSPQDDYTPNAFMPDVKPGDILDGDQIDQLPRGSVVEVEFSWGSKETIYVGESLGKPVFYKESPEGVVEALTPLWVKENGKVTLKEVGRPDKLLPWQAKKLAELMPKVGGVLVFPHGVVSHHLVTSEYEKKKGYLGIVLNDGTYTTVKADVVNKYKTDAPWYLNGMLDAGADTVDVVEGTVIQKNGHTYVLKNGRWHRQDMDVPTRVIEEAVKVKKETGNKAKKPKKKGELPVADMSHWKLVEGQKGSNPGGLYKVPNGTKVYAKFPKKADPRNELLAAKLYEMAGLKVPQTGLVEKDGKTGIASVWIDGLKQGKPADLGKANGAHDGFVVDAWLGNWDVVGTGYDNLLIDADGNAVRIDPGGALLYRAQGDPKGDDFGPEVHELKTMLDASVNSHSAKVFKGVSKEALLKGARRVAMISPEAIDELVKKAGPGSVQGRKKLAKLLKSRRAYILKHFGIGDPYAGGQVPVFESDIPDAPDFENWDGPGKGLSSKQWVNEGNNLAVAHIRKAALKGGLAALDGLKVPTKDANGAVKEIAVSDHPSSHVRAYYDLVKSVFTNLGNYDAKIPALGIVVESDKYAELTGFHPHGVTVDDKGVETVGAYFMRLDTVHANIPIKGHYITENHEFVKNGKKWYESQSQIMKSIVGEIQFNGSINHVFSGNHPVSINGKKRSPSEISKIMHKASVELVPGMILQRGMTVPEGTISELLALQPGDALQNTDSMCCSYYEHHDWKGNLWLRITCADGSRALPTFGSGEYSHEREVTTLPGARFIVKGKPEKKNGKVYLDVIMLPPHEDYLDTVEEAVQSGDLNKAVLLVFCSASGEAYG